MWKFLTLLLPFALMAADPARVNLNLGSGSNDGTGDGLRTTFTKINTNVINLWAQAFTNNPADLLTTSNALQASIDSVSTDTFLAVTNGTAVSLTGSLTNVTVDSVPSAQLISLQLLPPYAGTNYWALGDSQTRGQMGATVLTNWTDSGSRILETYRYPNRIAQQYSLNLTNLGISASGMRFDTNLVATQQTPFNQFGVNVPTDWSGLVTVMQGYNDALTSLTDSAWYRVWRNGQRALLARILAEGYVAGGTAGTTDEGMTYASFATDGTDYTDSGLAARNPFPIGNPGSDDRTLIELSGSQGITLTTTNRADVAIWYETSADSGTAWVYTNGIAVMSFDATVPHGGDTNRVAGVVMLRGLPTTTTTDIAITNISGTNRIMAIGWLPTAPALTRTVIIGTPLKLSSAQRDDVTINAIGRAAISAASEFADWNVGIADTSDVIDLETDLLAVDPNHPTHQGQWKIAKAFMDARRPSRGELTGVPWSGLPLAADGQFTTLEVSSTSQLTGLVTVGNGTGNKGILISGGDGSLDLIDFYTSGTASGDLRWRMERSSTAESGANAGSDFRLVRYNDSGVQSGVALEVTRSSGATAIGGPTTVGGTLASTGSATVGAGTGDRGISIAGGSGQIRYLDYNSGVATDSTTLRWRQQATSTAEAGANAGSDWSLAAYGDTGTIIGTALGITRSSMAAAFGGTVSSAGNITVGSGSGNRAVLLAGAKGSLSFVDFYAGGTASGDLRWRLRRDSTAESGSNVGSDFSLESYNDSGSLIGRPLVITRSTLATALGSSLTMRDSATVGNDGLGANGLSIGGASGSVRYVDFNSGAPSTAANLRWRIQANTTSESGADSGSDFNITPYTDGGVSLGAALSIVRSSGDVTVNRLTVTTNAVIANPTQTLTYSGTNVTFAPTGTLSSAALIMTNDCLLTLTADDGYSGGIVFKPDSSTSYTVYLDTGIKLLGGGTSFVVTNSASELVNFEWKQVYVNGSDRILANKAVYP